MATTAMKVAAAVFMTAPDKDGRYTRAVRGQTVDVDAKDVAVARAIERGHLIPADAPLPAPSSPAKQRAAATATTPAAPIEDGGPYAALLDGSVEDVNAYLDAHPDEVDAVVAAEHARAGDKARKGIIER